VGEGGSRRDRKGRMNTPRLLLRGRSKKGFQKTTHVSALRKTPHRRGKEKKEKKIGGKKALPVFDLRYARHVCLGKRETLQPSAKGPEKRRNKIGSCS